MASLYDPGLRVELGYFYNEYRGIHTTYVGYLAFVEAEILPSVTAGPDTFYERDELRPEFLVQKSLLEKVGMDLERVSRSADDMETRLRDLLTSL